jgi:hypothetical protein
MMVSGSINYTTSGRKRKTLRNSRNKPFGCEPIPTYEHPRRTKHIPSLSTSLCQTTKADTTMQQEVSSTYTIAPAYNKGAYQVISKSSLKDIGR